MKRFDQAIHDAIEYIENIMAPGNEVGPNHPFFDELMILKQPITLKRKPWWQWWWGRASTTLGDNTILLARDWLEWTPWPFVRQVQNHAANLIHEVTHLMEYRKQPDLAVWAKYVMSAKERYNFELPAYANELRFAVRHWIDRAPYTQSGFVWYLANKVVNVSGVSRGMVIPTMNYFIDVANTEWGKMK